MVSEAYAKAYTEVLEIIKYFPQKEYNKIPREKIEFYKKYMDKNYEFKINPRIDLAHQNISTEANAIIIILFRDYFATEEQKIKIQEILKLKQRQEEIEKAKKYNPDDLFKNNSGVSTLPKNLELTEYKESFFTRFKKFILNLFN